MHILRRSWPVWPAAMALLLAGCANQPVAIVNGHRITKQDFYDRLENYVDPETGRTMGERVMGDLIGRQLIADAFTGSGLTLTEQEITAEVERKKQQMGIMDAQQWALVLKQQHMEEATIRHLAAFDLKARKLAEKDVKYTEQDLRAHFAKYKGMFDQPELVKLSEIELSSRATADKVRGLLNEPKASFADLARKYSMSTRSRENGGLVPQPLPVASIQPESLRRAMQRMRKGEITPVVEIQGSWYILKVEEHTPAQTADYAKVKDKVREHYLYTHQKQGADLIAELQKNANVKILAPRYMPMQQMFGPKQALPTFGSEQKGAKGAPTAPATQTPATPGTPTPAAPATQVPAAPAPTQPAAPPAATK